MRAPAGGHVRFKHADLLDDVRVRGQHDGQRRAHEAIALRLQPGQSRSPRCSQLNPHILQQVPPPLMKLQKEITGAGKTTSSCSTVRPATAAGLISAVHCPGGCKEAS